RHYRGDVVVPGGRDHLERAVGAAQRLPLGDEVVGRDLRAVGPPRLRVYLVRDRLVTTRLAHLRVAGQVVRVVREAVRRVGEEQLRNQCLGQVDEVNVVAVDLVAVELHDRGVARPGEGAAGRHLGVRHLVDL